MNWSNIFSFFSFSNRAQAESGPPKVLRIRIRPDTGTYGITRDDFVEGVMAGFNIWREQSLANIRFVHAESGGWDYQVKTKELYLPSYGPCKHAKGLTSYNSRTIWIHSGYISKGHSCTRPDESYYTEFVKLENLPIFVGHEFGHTAFGLKHVSNIACLMNINGRTTSRLCAKDIRAVENKYGKRDPVLPPTIIIPGTKIDQWNLTEIKKGTIVLKDGRRIRLDGQKLRATGGKIRFIEPVPVDAIPSQIPEINSVDLEAQSLDNQCICGVTSL